MIAYSEIVAIEESIIFFKEYLGKFSPKYS